MSELSEPSLSHVKEAEYDDLESKLLSIYAGRNEKPIESKSKAEAIEECGKEGMVVSPAHARHQGREIPLRVHPAPGRAARAPEQVRSVAVTPFQNHGQGEREEIGEGARTTSFP